MCHFSNHVLSQIQYGLVIERVEEPHIEERLVSLLSILRLHAFGQTINYLLILLNFELLLYQV